ncbi:MAG TPA: chemotaxis protein CheA [Lysobacter sp.]|nr:chemotaxis protein CheA [Lysobacter sp.]
MAFPAHMLETFLAEARDLVQDLDRGLRRLREGDRSDDLVGRLFRAAHSIKGSGGMFGLAPLVTFTHVVENLLDHVRARRLDAGASLIGDLQESCDHIADLIEMLVAGGGGSLDGATLARDARLRQALLAHEPACGPVTPAQDATATATHAAATDPRIWRISIRFGEDVFRYGINPLSLIRDLEALGEIVALRTLAERIPAAGQMDPETCYLGFEIALCTDADRAGIAEVFDFVADCSELCLVAPDSPPADTGPIATSGADVAPSDLQAAMVGCDTPEASASPHGGHGAAAPLDGGAKPPAARASTAAVCNDAAFVRVRADRLDELINLVGELVIAGAGASLLADCSGQAALREAQANVSRLMEDIRERALRLRMVPIGETFSRFHRLVRDIERDLGKGIDLVVEGGETELDKSVVEKLADPLVHLVRNAADHGIEAADARTARGKPARGRIVLSAAHASGHVVIEIHDDGAGLDRARIHAKAVERGLVPAGAMLTDHETFQLIFEPGFSTAAQVTNLSGRGVGMDVVRRNITDLRGSIEIESIAGQGTTVRIRLPLTLAIIDGFLVGVGDAAFVLPLDRVVECIEMPEALRPEQGVLDLRGQALPLIRLREQLGIETTPRTRRQNVVVVDCSGRRAGLVVDALLGEFQTVIKPLGALFARLRGISGSTILGSGEVALILDVPELLDAALRIESQRLSVRQPGTPVASAASAVSRGSSHAVVP